MPSCGTFQGRTALHVASVEGHIEVASTLISKAATLLPQVDNDGRTSLHLAAANGHRDLLTILIGQGADVDAQDNVSYIIVAHNLLLSFL